jgi:hypothetical protein
MDVSVVGSDSLGLTGLEGSGFEEVMYALFGLAGYSVFGAVSFPWCSEGFTRLTRRHAMAIG